MKFFAEKFLIPFLQILVLSLQTVNFEQEGRISEKDLFKKNIFIVLFCFVLSQIQNCSITILQSIKYENK